MKEYFDDSIILLKNSTHWEYKDMVNMKLNLHGNKSKLSDEERNILRGKILYIFTLNVLENNSQLIIYYKLLTKIMLTLLVPGFLN